MTSHQRLSSYPILAVAAGCFRELLMSSGGYLSPNLSITSHHVVVFGFLGSPEGSSDFSVDRHPYKRKSSITICINALLEFQVAYNCFETQGFCMARVIIKNQSPFATINDIKAGLNANGSCDPSLKYLGRFELAPDEEREVALVEENTDLYWKNVQEYYWRHQAVTGSDDIVNLVASSIVQSSMQVDICNRESLVSTSDQLAAASANLYRDGRSPDIFASLDVGNGILFSIVGRNQDGYQIRRNGTVISYEWLWPHARDPGKLYVNEISTQLVSNGANIAFTWGRNDDLMFAIAVRGNSVFSTIGEYWKHRADNAVNVKPVWAGEGLARFSRFDVDEFLRFQGNRWVRL
ncbi:hypothetical protein [Cyanobium sp. CH-040]|uniref:hypothetical protein n=1 Tax=Cyanobium sp. CH-040 TaxID=2823708 RepID=UPI0020CDBCCE|nr:hypothetical protein [Cyanobium sp. CH-040]MCP9928592.1 hypothetical protein [Cyanobium sp. CH-040]